MRWSMIDNTPIEKLDLQKVDEFLELCHRHKVQEIEIPGFRVTLREKFAAVSVPPTQRKEQETDDDDEY